MMESVSCGSCHSYQGGGGARNTYGKDYARESMIMRDVQLPWEGDVDDFDDESDFPLTFGIDTRYQMIAQTDKDLRQFPMQFALYSGAEFGNLIAHVEVGRVLEEFKFTGGLRYEGLPLESWISVGKELPTLGWRIDDHSTFIRGGNLTTLGLGREGMPFTPFIDPPTLIEVGAAPLAGLELSVMAGSAFIQSDMIEDSQNFSAFKANYMLEGNVVTGHAGFGVLNEAQNTQATVATWGLASGNLVLLGEWSKMSGWPSKDASNLAVLHQMSYRILQGVEVVGRYEFFDPDMELQTGAINRTSIGLELFPVRGIEVKLGYRTSQLEFPGESSEPESQLLTQIHIYL